MPEPAKCYRSGSLDVSYVIIVLFVGGQVTNVEQNKKMITDFPAHKNVDVWLFLQLL